MDYVAYYRVSTQEQGRSGLGLESQKESVTKYIDSVNGTLLREYHEVASGSKDDRVKLNEAIQLCIDQRATLIVKKLDRLSRGGYKIAVQLDELGVSYIESDSPQDNELLKDLKLAIAKDERKKISERTKAALAVLKSNGVKLGKPENLTDTARMKAWEANRQRKSNNPNNIKAKAHIEALRKQGMNYSQIAQQLNDNGFLTSRGNKFQAVQVQRLVKN